MCEIILQECGGINHEHPGLALRGGPVISNNFVPLKYQNCIELGNVVVLSAYNEQPSQKKNMC